RCRPDFPVAEMTAHHDRATRARAYHTADALVVDDLGARDHVFGRHARELHHRDHLATEMRPRPCGDVTPPLVALFGEGAVGILPDVVCPDPRWPVAKRRDVRADSTRRALWQGIQHAERCAECTVLHAMLQARLHRASSTSR